ncbi:cupin domain-containing protein [Spirillospora sp. NPDC048911]|uniref:cupin domain-containing protein n=1 Tax=Spirillospora sp. NPDC048911 TaxID=3364527 RepID=UPI003720554F
MNEPERIGYRTPERYESGMVIEEAAVGEWPFKASRFEVPPGRTSELDLHDVAELWMVRSGTGTVVSGDARMDVGPGEMVYLASRVPHQITNTGEDRLRLFSVWWAAS